MVRASISLDPRTSAITIASDPLPQSVDGVPLAVKELEVTVDRPGFISNPTSCEATHIEATLTGASAGAGEPDQARNVSAPFGASNCAALPFGPEISATTSAHTSKADGASLQIKLTTHPGEANIHKFELQLPEALPSNDLTLQKACTQAQFWAQPGRLPGRLRRG